MSESDTEDPFYQDKVSKRLIGGKEKELKPQVSGLHFPQQ